MAMTALLVARSKRWYASTKPVPQVGRSDCKPSTGVIRRPLQYWLFVAKGDIQIDMAFDAPSHEREAATSTPEGDTAGVPT
jgi:hypothetical protein